MKKLIVLMVILIILPVSYALYDKNIYDDWVLSGEKFTIDNETYRAIYVKSSNSTVVYFPGGLSLAIRPENISCDSEWIYRACQTNQKFEKNGNPVPPDIHDPYIDVSLYLIINITDVRLDLNKSFVSDSLYVGDTISIETTIEKYSKEDITNVSFIDVFSDDFVITITKGCELKGSIVYWNGDMINKSRHVCTYSVRPVRETEITNTANLSYDVFGKKMSKSQSNNLKVEETVLHLSFDSLSENVSAGENTTINLTLEAINDIIINDLKIIFPGNFKLINQSYDFKIEADGLSISDFALNKEDSKNLFFIVQSGFVGTYEISLETDFVYNKLVKNIKKTVDLTYVGQTFFVSLLERNNKSILQLANPGTDYYRTIEAKINNNTFKLQRLDARKFHEFEFPFTNQETLNVSVRYWTKFGQIIYDTHLLKYGESTYIEVQDLVAQEDITDTKTDAEKQRSNINVDMGQVLTVFGIIIGVVFIIGIIFTIKSKFTKSGLDKEIEEIKEETTETEDVEREEESDNTYI